MSAWPVAQGHRRDWRVIWLATMAVAAVVALVLIGLRARVVALGDRPLGVDEYYFLTSIRSILAHGVPEHGGGGYYTRGILVQYLTAPLVSFLPNPHLALRIPPMLFGLGSVVLGYRLARRHVGELSAVAFALALFMSSWAVEFSRFGRMYAGFQFFFLLFLLAFDTSIRNGLGASKSAYLPLLVSVVAVLCHETAVFLAPLLFVPVLFWRPGDTPPSRDVVRYAAFSMAVALAMVLFVRFDWRYVGIADPYPGDYRPDFTSALRLPAFPFFGGGLSPSVLLLLPLGSFAVAGTILTGLRWRGIAVGGAHYLATAAVLFAAFHQLAVVALSLGVLALRYPLFRARGREWASVRIAVAASVALSGVWLGLGVLDVLTGTGERWVAAASAPSLVAAFRRTYLGWPDFYGSLYVVWHRDLPWVGLLVLISLSVLLVRSLKASPARALVTHPAAQAGYFLVPLACLAAPEESTRYAYFAYPLFLLLPFLLAAALLKAGGAGGAGPGRRILAALVPLGLFAGAGDFDLRHLLQIDSEAVSFRVGRYEGRERLWYPMRDYRSPAEFVEQQVREGDVVVAAQVPPVSAYLRRDHVVYVGRESHNFAAVSRAGGTRDLWSGRRMLTQPSELRSLTATAPRVWIVQRLQANPIVPTEVWAGRVRSACRPFTSKDGRIAVLLVELYAPGEATDGHPRASECGASSQARAG